MMIPYHNIICPNCKSTLLSKATTTKIIAADRVWNCVKNRHSFDVAKQGYLNLLLANQKKTLNPGDSKQMIRARHAFLETGAFDFLIQRLQHEVKSLFPKTTCHNDHHQRYVGLDLACGSGYYLRNILASDVFQRIGLDISKEATSVAARNDKNSLYLVASVFALPILDQSCDILLNIFAPIDLVECHRVLKPNGYLIKIIPDKNHMKEVAEMIYENVTEHSSNFKHDIETAAQQEFNMVKQFQLKGKIKPEAKNLMDFIAMTPYFYKFRKEQLKDLEKMEVTVEFVIYIIKKKGSALKENVEDHYVGTFR